MAMPRLRIDSRPPSPRPFPANSLTAAQVLLRAKGVAADAIYIDAAHDYDHVRADLVAWWPLVRTAAGSSSATITARRGRECGGRVRRNVACGLDLKFSGKWMMRKAEVLHGHGLEQLPGSRSPRPSEPSRMPSTADGGEPTPSTPRSELFKLAGKCFCAPFSNQRERYYEPQNSAGLRETFGRSGPSRRAATRDANARNTIVQSSSVVAMRMVGHPKNRLPISQRKSNLGIPLPYTCLNPSTRPS